MSVLRHLGAAILASCGLVTHEIGLRVPEKCNLICTAENFFKAQRGSRTQCDI